MRLIALLLLSAAPAWAADHPAIASRALEGQIRPGFDALAAETAALSQAVGDCSDPAAIREGYDRAFDAWMGVSHLRFGPLEEGETGFAIAFWPDARNTTPRTLAALQAKQDPVVDDSAAFAHVSIAGRGLFALDALLAEGATPAPGSYDCRLLGAVAADLAATSARADQRWRDPYAGYLTAPGPGNPMFLKPEDATRALFTAMISGLEATAGLRYARPLGEFMKPQPRRAEAWRTGRSDRNALLSVEAVQTLYEAAFAPELSQVARDRIGYAFDYALHEIGAAMPMAAALETVGGRLRVESAMQSVKLLIAALSADIGPAVGVAGGFNSMDGD